MSDTLYQGCAALFAACPLAAKAMGENELRVTQYMYLMEPTGGLFRLAQWDDRGEVAYSLRLVSQDGTKATCYIYPHTSGSDWPEFAAVLQSGTPLPRDGSIFGWKGAGDRVTALVIFTAPTEDASTRSGLAVLPRARGLRSTWPSFTDRPLSWSWHYVQTGAVVCLDVTIAGTHQQIYWVPGDDGSGMYVVLEGQSQGRAYLDKGVYAPHRLLLARADIPPVDELLRRPGVEDLSLRFRRQ